MQQAVDQFAHFLASHPLIGVLLAMQVADTATGVCVAIQRSEVASSVSFRGLTRKLVMWIVSAVCFVLQRIIPDVPLGDGAVALYCGVEGLSLIENVALLGLPVPAALKNVLDAMQRDAESSKQRAKKRPSIHAHSLEVKTDSMVVKNRDTTHDIDVVDDSPCSPE